ncbi:MAG: hypothetical protein JEZ14_06805 [Marinilabiliaceae bacterium]|nr:hypothetical protein [Marinilabiliaceae bacterium]
MKRNCKFCWIILGLFLLGNVLLLSVWWLKSNRCDWERGERRSSSREEYTNQMRLFLNEKASIDSVQFAQISILRGDYYVLLEPLKSNVDSLRKELAFYTFSDGKDTSVVADLVGEIVRNQQDIEYLNCKHYKEVRQVCYSEEQKRKLDQAFRDFISKHHKRRRGHGPR